MNLYCRRTTNSDKFLARHIADSIPFSSNKLPEILSKLSLCPSSEEAKVIKKTIKVCEETGIKAVHKFCATSLESMIDFSISKLGKNVKAIPTINAEKDDEYLIRKSNIVKVKKVESSDVVGCHRMEYAYPVFYCHLHESTVACEVSMAAAADGSSTMEAVAICHQDTWTWNPKHLAFQVLKVKPGEASVCHFLPEDDIA